MKLYAEKCLSKNNREYVALKLDFDNGFGERTYILTFDTNTIMRLSNYSPSMLENMAVGECTVIYNNERS